MEWGYSPEHTKKCLFSQTGAFSNDGHGCKSFFFFLQLFSWKPVENRGLFMAPDPIHAECQAELKECSGLSWQLPLTSRFFFKARSIFAAQTAPFTSSLRFLPQAADPERLVFEQKTNLFPVQRPLIKHMHTIFSVGEIVLLPWCVLHTVCKGN